MKYSVCSYSFHRSFDDQGNEPNWDIPKVIRLLREAGYDGCWGIECESGGVDEAEMVVKTLALIQRELVGD